MRRTPLFALVLAALLGSAHAAGAQQIPSPIRYVETTHSLGFFAGYLLTDPGIAFDTAANRNVELGPQSAPVMGVRYNLRFGGPLSGEASLGFSPTERKVYAPASETDPTPVELDRTEDVPLLVGEAGLRFHVTGPRTWHGLAPFVVGSAGVVADLDGSGDAEEDGVPETAAFGFGPSLAVGAAIGTDWFPTRRLSLRVEVRDHLWKISAPEGLRAPRQEISEWTHNVAFTLGGALHF